MDASHGDSCVDVVDDTEVDASNWPRICKQRRDGHNRSSIKSACSFHLPSFSLVPSPLHKLQTNRTPKIFCSSKSSSRAKEKHAYDRATSHDSLEFSRALALTL